MKRVHAIPIVLALAAAIGTFAVVSLREPDVLHATGDDGRVTVDGRGVGELAIVRVGVRTETDIPVWDISLNSLPVPADFLLTASYDPSVRATAPRPLSLFALDATLGAWRSVPTVDDPTTGTLSGRAGIASRRWTYATLPDPVIASETATVLDQLISFPPVGAVGYRAFVAVSPSGDDFFLLNEDFGQGGCAGMFREGRTRTVTSHDLRSSDKTTRYVVQWELADGCADGEKVL